MKRRGFKIEDGIYHEADHISFSRRRFMKSFGIAGGVGMMLNNLPVKASALSSWFAPPYLEKSDRVLIMIRLKGGNDGLNTIIPLQYLPEYHFYRPTLGHKDNQMVHLDDYMAMSPDMSKLKTLWDDGRMKVVQGVGYPEANFSHFRSSDIWASASDSDQYLNTGWVARYAEEVFPNYAEQPPTDPPCIQIGGASSFLFTGEHNSKIGFEAFSSDQILDIVATGQIHSLSDLPDCQYGDQLEFLRRLTNNTYTFVSRIKESYDLAGESSTVYDDNYFAASLKAIARLIKGGLKTKIYVVELEGFDTHANQLNDHPRLLQMFSGAISSFFADFELPAAKDYRDKVLAITFSEFGRRVQENDGPGTDHGAASVMLAFGAGLNGSGSVGDIPSLAELDDYGNLIYTTDFRHVYSTLMTEWLCLPDPLDDEVLKKNFGSPLRFGFDCEAIPSSNDYVEKSPYHHSATYSGGIVYINYSIPRSTMVMGELVSTDGKTFILERPINKQSGEYTLKVNVRDRGLLPGMYFYRIRVTGREMCGKLIVNT